MPQSSLIKEFIKECDNDLLCNLLRAYQKNLHLSDKQQRGQLVQVLKDELEERRDANTQP